MHWRGKDYFYELIYPDGRKQTLLSVPRWDFNWQNSYQFTEPIKVPKGTRLTPSPTGTIRATIRTIPIRIRKCISACKRGKK